MSTTWDQTKTIDGYRSTRSATNTSLLGLGWQVLRWMGSLKITVAMFALGIVILLVGTLAQDEETLEDVKRNYFNSWIAHVSLDVFFPITIVKDHQPLGISVPMPGGATIGLILLINLIAAKLTRFALQARGGKLVAGLFFLTLGSLLLLLVVIGAHLGDGLQGEPPFSYDLVWLMTKASLWISAVASLAWAIGWPPKYKMVRVVAWVVAATSVGLSLTLLLTNDAFRIPDPGLRIVWQLAKSFFVGITMLIGMILLFGKRGGNVLIHFGVGLLMLGQFIFGDQQVEERVTFYEGQTTNLAYRINEVELAILDLSPENHDNVLAFDASFLERSADNKSKISDPSLPFDIQVEKWMVNSITEPFNPDLVNLATAGTGLRKMATPSTKQGGASSRTNLASAYITIRDKSNGQDLGTYLVSQMEHDPTVSGNPSQEIVHLNGKDYGLQLRFRQTLKDYSLTLEDAKRENYTGTATPRDYSSEVRIMSNDGKELQKGRIWMNNPIRFRGETFYQSGYVPGEKTENGLEQSTLQVVTNAGWLIPYVSCVLCGLGMLVHFSTTFVRFAMRYERDAGGDESSPLAKSNVIYEKASSARRGKLAWLAPTIGLGIVAFISLSMARPRTPKGDEFDWNTAGQLPMLHEGRIKPLDTVARNVLQAISNKTSLKNEANLEGLPKGKKVSATQWLLCTMAGQAWTKDIECIRIEAKEVLDTLGLEPRSGLRYSYNEVSPNMRQVYEIVDKLDPENEDNWSFIDRKLAQLTRRMGLFESIIFGYSPLIPEVPTEAEGEAGVRRFQSQWDFYEQMVRMVERNGTAAIIPPSEISPDQEWKKQTWRAYGPALFRWLSDRRAGIEHDDRLTHAFGSMLGKLNAGNGREFNVALKKFRGAVASVAPSESDISRTRLEAWYNAFGPINFAAFFYVFIGVITAFNIAFGSQQLRRVTFWMCVGILIVHTIGIVCRIYISQKPPVINLYSSAVIVGWFVVLLGLIVEMIAPIGLGTIVGSISGFLSLMVAYGLDTGDSMPVLQAVLDTQFWLATHVTCVTLGYGATYGAGFMGIAYLFLRFGTDAIRSPERRQTIQFIIKMVDLLIYGLVCAAIFFSFVGTVLGGLWGDDSWGRFWGWDPKENGALMIVLWNALLLHARWDKMVGHRGFALLAIGGNIITSWSWFGTNQLGIGLHSYGFTSGILATLAVVAISQILLIVSGWIFVRPQPPTINT